MSGPTVRLALFDLDGTLVRPGSVLQRMHMDAMAAAIAAASGSREPFTYCGGELFYRGVNLAGFTDAGTIRAALVLAGVPQQEAAARLPAVVADMVEQLNRASRPEGWHGSDDLLPGARDILAALRGAGFTLGMSTGNARAVASWKMRAAGLGDLFDGGGFGDRFTEREDVAASGATSLCPPGAVSSGVLVGDTVRDVQAAHAAGLRCLAVSTGAAQAAELRSAGADFVLPGLGGALPVLLRLTDRPVSRREPVSTTPSAREGTRT